MIWPTKIIIYGGKDGGKYDTAAKLLHDNPFLSQPAIITNPSSMKEFLSKPFPTVGIINATCSNHIVRKCPELKFGNVIFLADPLEIDTHASPPADLSPAYLAACKSWRQANGRSY